MVASDSLICEKRHESVLVQADVDLHTNGLEQYGRVLTARVQSRVVID